MHGETGEDPRPAEPADCRRAGLGGGAQAEIDGLQDFAGHTAAIVVEDDSEDLVVDLLETDRDLSGAGVGGILEQLAPEGRFPVAVDIAAFPGEETFRYFNHGHRAASLEQLTPGRSEERSVGKECVSK